MVDALAPLFLRQKEGFQDAVVAPRMAAHVTCVEGLSQVLRLYEGCPADSVRDDMTIIFNGLMLRARLAKERQQIFDIFFFAECLHGCVEAFLGFLRMPKAAFQFFKYFDIRRFPTCA